MKVYISLFEAKQVGIIYHFTTYDAIISILKENTLKSKFEDFLSFTRNKQYKYSQYQVKIVFDGNKLSENNKLEPYNWFSAKHWLNPKDEQEERLMKKELNNIHKYIIRIVIHYDASRFYKDRNDHNIKRFVNELKKFKKSNYQIELINFPPLDWEGEILV